MERQEIMALRGRKRVSRGRKGVRSVRLSSRSVEKETLNFAVRSVGPVVPKLSPREEMKSRSKIVL